MLSEQVQTSAIYLYAVSCSYALWTCWTTSSLIGAVKTAGRGREVEASEKKIQWLVVVQSHEDDVPPEEDRTLTVGREAIVGVLLILRGRFRPSLH